jgi:hypothetical protein
LREHRVVLLGSFVHFIKLLDPFDALDTHILGDFHGIRTPGGDHDGARPDKGPLDLLIADEAEVSE